MSLYLPETQKAEDVQDFEQEFFDFEDKIISHNSSLNQLSCTDWITHRFTGKTAQVIRYLRQLSFLCKKNLLKEWVFFLTSFLIFTQFCWFTLDPANRYKDQSSGLLRLD